MIWRSRSTPACEHRRVPHRRRYPPGTAAHAAGSAPSFTPCATAGSAYAGGRVARRRSRARPSRLSPRLKRRRARCWQIAPRRAPMTPGCCWRKSLSGQRQYAQAAIAFDDAYNSSRKGSHAQEALVGLASSLSAINEKKAACDTLARLRTDFPSASPRSWPARQRWRRRLAAASPPVLGTAAGPPSGPPTPSHRAADFAGAEAMAANAVAAPISGATASANLSVATLPAAFTSAMDRIGPFEPRPALAVAVSGGRRQHGARDPRPGLGAAARRLDARPGRRSRIAPRLGAARLESPSTA